MDLSALRPIKNITEFETAVQNLINTNFVDSYLFNVIEERKKYDPHASEYIWEQNKGLKPYVCEVYFDGEYVMDVPSNMYPDEALRQIKKKVAIIIADKAKKKDAI